MILSVNGGAQDTNNGDFKVDPELALTKPDEFNWSLLVAISKKAPDSLQFKVGPNEVTTNNAVWETWADDPFTFPREPDPANPPKWEERNKPASGKQGLAIQPVTQLQLRFNRAPVGLHAQALINLPSNGEAVFRNKSSFDFIIRNQLFYREGLAAAFKKGVNDNQFLTGPLLQFDAAAVELKAVYRPLGPEAGNPAVPVLTKDNCHWNYDAKGNPIGLVALHIMSKQIPNWTWATWEWSGNADQPQPTGNPGRSDWYGSRDMFGVVYNGTPHYQAPHVDARKNLVFGLQYPSGSVSEELKKQFQDAGYSHEWQKEWSNYRLKGSQIDFTDAAGAAVLLGNSVTEDGFVQSSSCMTCHGNAAVAANGGPNASGGFRDDGQSRNGPLDPGWFYDVNTFDPTQQQFGRYQVRYYPIDFIWAVPFKAHPKKQ
jgi:hypothetical protein